MGQAVEYTSCVRDSNETCRGKPHTFQPVPVEPSHPLKWTLPALQTKQTIGGGTIAGERVDHTGLYQVAFGDTDGDGDADMIGLVCRGYDDSVIDKVHGGSSADHKYTFAHLVFYENNMVQGSKQPVWVEREEWSLSSIATPLYSERHFMCGYGSNPSMLTLVDYDHDGDVDLLFYGLTYVSDTISHYGTMYFFKNEGNSTVALWNPVSDVDMVTSVSGLGPTYKPRSWKPIFFDIDADGDLDALVEAPSVGGTVGTSFYENIQDYSSSDNDGLLPVFLDRGLIPEAAIPSSPNIGGFRAVGDLDNDGDLDLIVSQSTTGNRFYVVENVGTPHEAAWRQVRTASAGYGWLGLTLGESSYGYWNPILHDLNGDGMVDLVIQMYDYKLRFFVRAPLHGGVDHFLQNYNWALKDEDVGGEAHPVGVDLNGDGFTDLVVGSSGSFPFRLYENTGQKVGSSGIGFSGAVQISLKDDAGNEVAINKCRPTFIDADMGNGPDGDFDLVVGTYHRNPDGGNDPYYISGLYFFENVGTKEVWDFRRREDWSLQKGSALTCTGGYCFTASLKANADDLDDLFVYNSNNYNKIITQMAQSSPVTPTPTPLFEELLSIYGNKFEGLLISSSGNIVFGDLQNLGYEDAIGAPYNYNGEALVYFKRDCKTCTTWTIENSWSLAGVGVGAEPKVAL